MTIEAILNDKGVDVIAVCADETVQRAVEVMHQRHIGALVVMGGATSGDGDMIGIFTERDVIRALATHGAAIFAQPLGKHMTERPASVRPDTSVNEAMTIMTEKKFRHLPVLRDAALCGIISIGDLVNYKIHQTEQEAAAMRDYITG